MSATDTAGRTRVTRMTADGTVKNVWAPEQAAEVDLVLETATNPQHGRYAEPFKDWSEKSWADSVQQEDGSYVTW